MAKLSKSINILVCPTDSCNMNCKYCFHKPYHGPSDIMSVEVLEKLIDLACTEYESVQFIWHGGEPLLAGIDFYKRALNIQKKYPECKIKNSMQSNITLLDKESAQFFIDNKFGLGSSFDGVSNDVVRGNSDEILNSYKMYTSLGAEMGFIMVLSKFTINSLEESYELFKKLGANFSINRYIPILGDDVNNEKFSVPNEITIEKLCNLFDYWINDSECNIHLNTFEEYLRFILYHKTKKCRFSSCLGRWLCVRYDGIVMPCNRYFPEEYQFGNVRNFQKISDAYDSDGFRRLLTEAISRREICKNCNMYSLCKGGCNNIAYVGGNVNRPNNDYCMVMKAMYSYMESWVKYIDENQIRNPMIRALFKHR